MIKIAVTVEKIIVLDVPDEYSSDSSPRGYVADVLMRTAGFDPVDTRDFTHAPPARAGEKLAAVREAYRNADLIIAVLQWTKK